jgi:hypothetical protein
MKKLTWLLLFFAVLFLLASPVLAANKVVARGESNKISLDLSVDEPLGGVAIALKFADEGSNVICSKAYFSNDEGVVDQENGFNFLIINNETKTIGGAFIPFHNNISKGENKAFLNLEFRGEGKVKLEEAAVSNHYGVVLVNIRAEEIPFEFNPPEINVSKQQVALPKEFSLSQNYLNPFNPTTSINYALPTNSYVKLVIYNVLGQRVKTLVDEEQTAGYKQVVWNGHNDNGEAVGSGIYFYRIQAGDFTKTAKMSLLK